MSNEQAFTFPHATLTGITGEPTAETIAVLRKQLYANAKAIPTHLGGIYGHLSIMMDVTAYNALPGAIPFPPPANPGDLPAFTGTETQFQIQEVNRRYDLQVKQHATYIRAVESLKQQLIAAVGATYIRALEDPDFGYSFVTPLAILSHLTHLYGAVKAVDLDRNREALCAAWTPDDNIEALWLRIDTCQRLAHTGGEPIPDTTAMRLILTVLEKTGVFTYAIDTWRVKHPTMQSMAEFRTHFRTENEERVRKLTANTAGYHTANVATTAPAPNPSYAHAATTPTRPGPTTGTHTPTVFVDGHDCRMYYCWTHGLGFSKNHTSTTCNTRAPGHIETATIRNPQGGSDKLTFSTPRNERRRTPARTAPTNT